MKKNFSILGLVLLACGVAWSASSSSRGARSQVASREAAKREAPSGDAASFPIFSAVHLKDHPDLSRYGLRPIHMIYASQLWPKDQPRDQPHENAVRLAARRAAATGGLVCVDIEQWMDGLKERDASAGRSIRKYQRVADWMHHAEPGLRLGFYAVPPIRNYWSVMKGGKPLEVWHRQNARLEALAEHVDVLFPSLYTFYDEPRGWVTYARANLEQAHRYHKRVYAFLMPFYHPSNDKLAGEPIPGDFWKLELETCRRYADGVVIWSGSGQAWDRSAPWWRQTLAFLREVEAPSPEQLAGESPE